MSQLTISKHPAPGDRVLVRGEGKGEVMYARSGWIRVRLDSGIKETFRAEIVSPVEQRAERCEVPG